MSKWTLYPFDGLPDDDTSVLLWDDEDVYEGYRRDERWYTASGSETHPVAWRHMPAPPQPVPATATDPDTDDRHL